MRRKMALTFAALILAAELFSQAPAIGFVSGISLWLHPRYYSNYGNKHNLQRL